MNKIVDELFQEIERRINDKSLKKVYIENASGLDSVGGKTSYGIAGQKAYFIKDDNEDVIASVMLGDPMTWINFSMPKNEYFNVLNFLRPFINDRFEVVNIICNEDPRLYEHELSNY